MILLLLLFLYDAVIYNIVILVYDIVILVIYHIVIVAIFMILLFLILSKKSILVIYDIVQFWFVVHRSMLFYINIYLYMIFLRSLFCCSDMCVSQHIEILNWKVVCS